MVSEDTTEQEPQPLNGERLLSFSEAARRAGVPGARGGAHVNSSTLFRWATRGAPAAGGMRLRLEAVRAGGRWLTSTEAVRRFVAKLTEMSLAPDAPASPAPTPARRARAAQRASAEVGALLNT